MESVAVAHVDGVRLATLPRRNEQLNRTAVGERRGHRRPGDRAVRGGDRLGIRARHSVLLLDALRGHRLRIARAPRGAECAGQQRADYDNGFHDHDRLAAEAVFDAIAKCSTSRAPRPTASATSSRTACPLAVRPSATPTMRSAAW